MYKLYLTINFNFYILLTNIIFNLKKYILLGVIRC